MMSHDVEEGYSRLGPLLSQKEVAQRLGRCSRQTVWRLGRDGRLPVVRLRPGGRPFYLESDVEQLIRAHRQSGTSG